MQSLVWKRYAWLIGGQTIPILPNTLRPDFKFQKVNYRNQMVRDRFYRKLKKTRMGLGWRCWSWFQMDPKMGWKGWNGFPKNWSCFWYYQRWRYLELWRSYFRWNQSWYRTGDLKLLIYSFCLASHDQTKWNSQLKLFWRLMDSQFIEPEMISWHDFPNIIPAWTNMK